MDNTRPKEQSVHRLHIDGYASDGSGVARLDGMVVFVQGGIRGEECEVQLTHVGRSALWGKVKQIITPSPARTDPQCPYYGRCGGCQYRHMDYAEELEAKRIRVEDALRRLGGAEVTVPPVLGAAHIDRYRNKAQFPVSPGPRIGFYRSRTHQVVDVEDCLLQSEAATRLRRAVKQWMQTWSIPGYNERTRTGLVRHVYVRTNRAGRSLCCLLVNGRGVPRQSELVAALRQAEPGLAGVVLGINESHSNVILGEHYRTLWGEDFLSDLLCGHRFQLSVPSFYQVNPDQAEVLYAKALEFSGLTAGETALDLYCGIGTISLVLASRAGMVWGAEVVPQAVDDAIRNAQWSGIENVRFLCADAGEAARRLAAEGVRPDVVCVDPPRKGLAEDVVNTIAAMAPSRVVYVSCDPGTLGRDVKRFAALGYTLRKAAAVDMFPRTAHVETVCLLSKLNAKQHIEINLDMDELDLTDAEKKATYQEIKDYVLEHSGLKVSSLYIAQVKQKCGIIERENYNKPKSEDAKQPQCPPDKEKAIEEALTHFGMI
ncbi:23S rRNA (uracil(1939)-C(5))-methyltransferase RlmD [Flavonifractor hominis]|uniref:23S rRNA (Uracil(1939)-C(5))-methyltransferase RlmD n=1 Tax=Flavonifractor hominis TaxID=3133178 RepID=A0ABV1ESM9_9FIRM